jgi:hypothetical protein
MFIGLPGVGTGRLVVLLEIRFIGLKSMPICWRSNLWSGSLSRWAARCGHWRAHLRWLLGLCLHELLEAIEITFNTPGD